MTKNSPQFVGIRHAGVGAEMPRSSIAGTPWLPKNADIPRCSRCGSSMQLFFQFDLEARYGRPFETDSHFVLFMCPSCNEIPSFEFFSDGKLPEKFWEKAEGHFFAALYRPGIAEQPVVQESMLEAFSLDFQETSDQREGIVISGTPSWIQGVEEFTCPCGEPMEFFCQVQENYPFPKLPAAPEQPDSFSANDYCLFLGNEIYILACKKQCNERAVWIVVQN